jgi:hypothetical protein
MVLTASESAIASGGFGGVRETGECAHGAGERVAAQGVDVAAALGGHGHQTQFAQGCEVVGDEGLGQAGGVGAAALAGDREAADKVELDLPETGVCTSSRSLEATSIADAAEGSGCCGTAAEADSGCGTSAESGSGCGASQPEPVAIGARGLSTGVLHGYSGERIELKQTGGCCG